MTPDGTTDNSQYIQTLMNGIMPATSSGGGGYTYLSSVSGQQYTPYLFNQPFHYSRGGTLDCGGYSGPRASTTALVFPAGVNGLVLDTTATSPDGGTSASLTLQHCQIYSLGHGNVGSITSGNANITATMVGYGALPVSTWNAGDGFVLYPGSNPAFTISSGSIAGTVLTVNTVSVGVITVGSVVTGTNVLPNTFVSSFGTGTGGAGTYNLSISQPSSVTATTFSGRNLYFSPIVPPGAYIDSASGGNLTIHAGFEPTVTQTTGVIWQLPATQAYTISATNGSNSFTVTSGPSADPSRNLLPGDFVWSQPYKAGCVVNTVNGAAVTLTDSAMLTAQAAQCNASAATGSYTLWVMPSCVRDFTQVHMSNNYCYGFPIGYNIANSVGSTIGGSSAVANSTASTYVHNTSESAIVGFLEAGDNTGGSTWVSNEGLHSSNVDFANLGAPGSLHSGDEMNSAEETQSPISMASNCNAQNFSPWLGNYFGMPQLLPSCIPTSDMLMTATAAQSNANGAVELFPVASGPSDIPALATTGFTNNPLFAWAWKSGQPGAYFNTTRTALYPMFLSSTGVTTNAVGWNYNSTVDGWQISTANNTSLQTSVMAFSVGTSWAANGGYNAGTVATAAPAYPVFVKGFTGGGAGTMGNDRLYDFGTVAQTNTNTSITAAQAFISANTILAVSTVTGVTGGSTATDTTVSATAVIGTIKSSNTTQNWLVLSGTSSHASSTGANVIQFNGANPITASDWYSTATQTMIPVASCAGVPTGAATVTDHTDGDVTIATNVVSCGTGQATMVIANTAGTGRNSSGSSDTIAVAIRRQGDFRFMQNSGAGSTACNYVTDYVGTVTPGCPIALTTDGKEWKVPLIARGAATNKTSSFTIDTTQQIWTATDASADNIATLPAATGSGAEYTIIKTDAAAHNVVLTAAGSDTINGAGTFSLTAQYKRVTVVDAASAKWYIVNSN